MDMIIIKNKIPKGGIYCIQNTVDGKVYVGSAINIKWRHYTHLRSLHNGDHHSIKLQRAWNKYGEERFIFSVVEEVEDKSLLIQREQIWIEKLKAYGLNGYNMVPLAGTNLGMICSAETKKKIGDKAKGRIVSDETTARMSASAPKTRPPLSEEHKKKIAATLTGLHPGESTRAKMSASGIGKRKGLILSAETKAKISASRIGIKLTPEHRAKISESLMGNHYALGYKHSPETRTKISLAGKGRVFSAERNAKMAATLRGRKKTPEHIANHKASLLLFYARKQQVAESQRGELCA